MSKQPKRRGKRKRRTADTLFHIWCKVNELSSDNYTISQISRQTGVDRKTVRKYLRIKFLDEALKYFEASRPRASPKMAQLQEYKEFFLNELRDPVGFSYAQIIDHFLEHYPNAPHVSNSTIMRYLYSLRESASIETKSRYSRDYRRRVPEGWGEEAEVDFGEDVMEDDDQCPHTLYFILVALKASCFKALYFMDKKFDAEHAVYGLHLAFRYFDGRPKKVIFDQDRVWLVDENFGEYRMTQKLEEFVKAAGFQPVFCRAYDPESKGRVERYVGFVKKNFLRGRKYTDCKTLNEQALAWLSRTGNGKEHDFYQKSPKEMFQVEREFMLPYNLQLEDPDWKPEERSVHKDNTIRHNGSLYDVPPGTYKGRGTKVLVDDRANPDYLLIMDLPGHVIIQYPKTDQKNVHFTLPEEMVEEKMGRQEEALRRRLDQWDDNDPVSRLIKNLKEKDIRYYKDVLREINRMIEHLDTLDAMSLVKYCADNNLTTVKKIMEAKRLLRLNDDGEGKGDNSLDRYDHPDYNPDGPSLDDYD